MLETFYTSNIIQIKNHKIATHDIYKISFLCFDEKKFILNNSKSGLALDY